MSVAGDTNTITATYKGLTATFNVNVTAATVEYVTITWNLRSGRWAGGFTPVTQIEKGGMLAFEYEPDTYFEPVKNNCEFAWHWYTDRELTQEFWGEATDWPPKVIINNDLTLYAEWKQITPQFYWGNYIPSTIVQATDLAGSPVFDIDELVETVENARTRHSLPSGQPTTHNNIIVNQDGTTYGVYNSGGDLIADVTAKVPGAIRWQEFKDWENAVKADKPVTWTDDSIGYRFFAYPKEFGLLKGITMIPSMDVMMGEYPNIVEVNIDGVDYYIYHTNTIIASGDAIHRFEF